jgi:hypothetical protein
MHEYHEAWSFQFVLESQSGPIDRETADELFDRIVAWAEHRKMQIGGGYSPAGMEDEYDGAVLPNMDLDLEPEEIEEVDEIQEVRITALCEVTGPLLDLTEVEMLLGQPPRAAYAAPPEDHQASAHSSEFSEGIWKIRSGIDHNRPLEEHVEALVAKMLPAKDLLRDLKTRGYRLGIYVGITARETSGDFRLPPSLLGQLSDLGIPVHVSVWG